MVSVDEVEKRLNLSLTFENISAGGGSRTRAPPACCLWPCASSSSTSAQACGRRPSTCPTGCVC